EVDALRCVLLGTRTAGVTARVGHPDDAQPAAAATRPGFVGDDGQVPGAKAGRIVPQLAHCPPRLESRPLNGILGLVPVPQDCAGELRSRFDQGWDERLERGEIACPGPVNQPTLRSHHAYNFGKRDVVANESAGGWSGVGGRRVGGVAPAMLPRPCESHEKTRSWRRPRSSVSPRWSPTRTRACAAPRGT